MFALRTEIADMTIHAAPLIQARTVEDLPEEDTIPPVMPLLDYTNSTQLASDQPPRRAHAKVPNRN